MNRLDIPSPPTQENKVLCCLTREKKCLVTIGSSLLSFMLKKKVLLKSVEKKKKVRGHPDLNRGPLDLQSNALPLSYTPTLRN